MIYIVDDIFKEKKCLFETGKNRVDDMNIILLNIKKKHTRADRVFVHLIR